MSTKSYFFSISKCLNKQWERNNIPTQEVPQVTEAFLKNKFGINKLDDDDDDDVSDPDFCTKPNQKRRETRDKFRY